MLHRPPAGGRRRRRADALWEADIDRPSGPAGTLRASADPESAGAVRVLGIRDGRDSNEEDRAVAGGRDALKHARETRVALVVDRDVAGIDDGFGLRAGVA